MAAETGGAAGTAATGRRVVAKRRIVTVRDGRSATTTDELAGEEPLELRLDGQRIAVTMRTPGDDFDLAFGFAVTEGLVGTPAEIATLRYCVDVPTDQQYNVVDVRRRVPGPVEDRLRRNVYISSSCGVCGTASIEGVRRAAADVAGDDLVVDAGIVAGLPDRLRAEQRVFDRTGGLHAAGLFDAGGNLLCLREDVGRHNAVDKVVGWAAREGRLPLRGCILTVSGRIAFEIVQKALIAGLPMVVAISAPTSLAVALAEESGVTLAGFVRGGGMNLYSHAHRVVVP